MQRETQRAHEKNQATLERKQENENKRQRIMESLKQDEMNRSDKLYDSLGLKQYKHLLSDFVFRLASKAARYRNNEEWNIK